MAKNENHFITARIYAVIYHKAHYQTLKGVSWHLGLKTSSYVFVFVVPKHIAHKMVITSNFVSQNFFINF